MDNDTEMLWDFVEMYREHLSGVDEGIGAVSASNRTRLNLRRTQTSKPHYVLILSWGFVG